MPPTHPYLRRTTTSVLVAVALVSGGILLLGDRFDVTPGYALTRPAPASARIAACVADENLRLIDPDLAQCHPGEVELTTPRPGLRPTSAPPVASDLASTADAARPPGPSGAAGTDGVSGFEIVQAKIAVPSRRAASGEARCPAGKVALGGGVLSDPESGRKAEEAGERMQIVASAPLIPGGDGVYGWVATVRNPSSGGLSVVVAVVCVALL